MLKSGQIREGEEEEKEEEKEKKEDKDEDCKVRILVETVISVVNFG